MSDPRSIDWYFDFISPFAYFQHYRLVNHYPDVTINYKPVLFGVLLRQNGHKGPAEIESKRLMTYRYCVWFAKQNNIPFQFPAAHPFKPISILRMALSAGLSKSTVSTIFDAIWVDGLDPATETNLFDIAKRLNLENPVESIQQDNVKSQLRDNTDQASALGVFGVPTIVINETLFWGDDLTEFALEYEQNQSLFSQSEFTDLDSIPSGLGD